LFWFYNFLSFFFKDRKYKSNHYFTKYLPYSQETSNQRNKNLINVCVNCEKVCKETIMHCLNHGGRHADPKHIGLMNDCANICRASAELMILTSPIGSSVKLAIFNKVNLSKIK